MLKTFAKIHHWVIYDRCTHGYPIQAAGNVKFSKCFCSFKNFRLLCTFFSKAYSRSLSLALNRLFRCRILVSVSSDLTQISWNKK